MVAPPSSPATPEHTEGPTLSRSGTVLSGTGGIWRVLCEDADAGREAIRAARDAPAGTSEIVDASLRGRLKREGGKDVLLKLAVGDRVDVTREGADAAWSIARIHERHSQLARRSPTGGYGERVVVANVDQVLVVFAAARPEPHPRMLDRFLVIAEANDLAVQVVINKCDLVSAADALRPFADHIAAGYPVHTTSAVTGEGLEGLRTVVQGRMSALSGPSGVGKSSLMNALFPNLGLRVGAISDSVNKGRHTTVGALLHPLPGGGFIADTPGLREVGLWGIEVSAVASCFPEFRPWLDGCRFADCTHLVEPGCTVREAVHAGQVSRARYDSFAKLREELVASSANNY